MNLGLIPSSEAGWVTACAALRIDSGGILHVHANVTSNKQRGQQTTHYTHVPSCDRNNCSSEMNRGVSTSASKIADDDSYDNSNTLSAASTTREHIANNGTECMNQQISDLMESTVERKEDTSCQGGNSIAMARADVSTHSTISSNNILPSGIDSATAATAKVRMMKFAKTCAAKLAWRQWSETACKTLRCHLSDMQRRDWSVSVLHIEYVKSYAPHIDHIVVDVECRPPS